MIWNQHLPLIGKHAFLSASKYHWLNYDDEKLTDAYMNSAAMERGTKLHAFAAQCIELNQKLPRSQKTLNMYVNDCIGFKMQPEQPLYYSPNCFGTADAICFRDNFLRIHDLKSGVVPAHMDQLEIYAGLFCLEYSIDPNLIKSELRIYQNNEIVCHNPTADRISWIMDRIVTADDIIERIK